VSDLPDDDGGFLKPWQKVGIWSACIVGGFGLMLLFSGRMITIGKREAKAEPAHAQVDTNIQPLALPPATTQPLPAPRPAYAGPAAAKTAAADNGDWQAAWYNSPLGGYSARQGGGAAQGIPDGGRLPPGSADALEASLRPTEMEGTKVAELPDPRWLIEQGRILPCVQLTRVNSTLPGGVSAIIPTEIRGETGDTVLFDKGAKIFGTVQHALMNGADRLAVLWQGITTPVLYDASGMPHQFRIAVNSPASSELGETGLDGDVNRHLGIKVGGILGMSLVQGGIQAGVQYAAKSQNGTQINLNSFQSGGNSAAETLEQAWVSIPDVMTRNQGTACGIQVVRDLDMRDAYKLRTNYGSN
jgi:type IV secretion system protein VirB10